MCTLMLVVCYQRVTVASHGSIIPDPGFDQVISMQSDHMIVNFAFNLSFTITILERKDWVEPSKYVFPTGDLLWFADGSKLKGDQVQECMV